MELQQIWTNRRISGLVRENPCMGGIYGCLQNAAIITVLGIVSMQVAIIYMFTATNAHVSFKCKPTNASSDCSIPIISTISGKIAHNIKSSAYLMLVKRSPPSIAWLCSCKVCFHKTIACSKRALNKRGLRTSPCLTLWCIVNVRLPLIEPVWPWCKNPGISTFPSSTPLLARNRNNASY